MCQKKFASTVHVEHNWREGQCGHNPRDRRHHLTWRLCGPEYTDLSVGTVTQTQAIPYTGPISLLVSQLRCLTGKASAPPPLRPPARFVQIVCVCLRGGDVEQVESAEKITIRIFKSITLVHESGMVLLEVGKPRENVLRDDRPSAVNQMRVIFLSGWPTRSTTCTLTW